eukprot:1971386-Rhodomonas_salina.1
MGSSTTLVHGRPMYVPHSSGTILQYAKSVPGFAPRVPRQIAEVTYSARVCLRSVNIHVSTACVNGSIATTNSSLASANGSIVVAIYVSFASGYLQRQPSCGSLRCTRLCDSPHASFSASQPSRIR